MSWSLRTITPAIEPAVGMMLAKQHARIPVTDTSEEALLQLLLESAHNTAEGYLGRALMTQTLELGLDCFPCGREIKLLRPPLQSVTSLKYTDPDGDEQTFSAGNYAVDTASEPGRIVLVDGSSWPDIASVPNAVRIRYQAGYASVPLVPADIRLGLLITFADLYSERESFVTGTIVSRLPATAEAKWFNHRCWDFA